PRAGDGHRFHHHIDAAVDERVFPFFRTEAAVFDPIGVAEQVTGHLAGDIGVESDDDTAVGVAEAEQVTAGVQPDHEAAAGTDPVQGGPGGGGAGGAQARGGVGAVRVGGHLYRDVAGYRGRLGRGRRLGVVAVRWFT